MDDNFKPYVHLLDEIQMNCDEAFMDDGYVDTFLPGSEGGEVVNIGELVPDKDYNPLRSYMNRPLPELDEFPELKDFVGCIPGRRRGGRGFFHISSTAIDQETEDNSALTWESDAAPFGGGCLVDEDTEHKGRLRFYMLSDVQAVDIFSYRLSSAGKTHCMIRVTCRHKYDE